MSDPRPAAHIDLQAWATDSLAHVSRIHSIMRSTLMEKIRADSIDRQLAGDFLDLMNLQDRALGQAIDLAMEQERQLGHVPSPFNTAVDNIVRSIEPIAVDK